MNESDDAFFRNYLQVNCVITFHLTISLRSEINILPLFIEIEKNITFFFFIFILLHKNTYQCPLLIYSLANRGGHRNKRKIIHWKEIKKKKENEKKENRKID